MVEISKHLFDSTCRDVHCSVLIHPWGRSCWTSSIETYKNSFIGSAKFYILVHLAQNLLKGKKMLKKKELMKAGEYYARSTLLGALICGSITTLSCSLRWLLGRKFTYYTYMLLPCTINGVFILLEPPKRRGLVINLFCNLVIEFWIRLLERDGYLNMTKGKQTFMFMIGSAFLFYLMRLEGERGKRTPLLWLFRPDNVRRKTDDSQTACPHDGSCTKHILKGAFTYFGVGFAFTMARVLSPRISTPLKALASVRRKDFNMGLFFASYIGIYRAVVCYLCRKQGYDSAMYALPAGYLAGLSFLLKPSLGFAIASVTGAFKLYSTILYEKKILTEKIPLPLIMYCLSQGLLFHSHNVHQDICPQYVKKLMYSVSNGKSKIILQQLLDTVGAAV
ncbi:transmembrane protein 135-like [Melitaea cinxia]|uniref:transmembrane protein 135-like n=1 Tax=Melitaea cinxia TaxID=113334 RepID=UPI001E26EAE6|nr:transmembrane protein 135-like [Melitaea cinxia]